MTPGKVTISITHKEVAPKKANGEPQGAKFNFVYENNTAEPQEYNFEFDGRECFEIFNSEGKRLWRFPYLQTRVPRVWRMKPGQKYAVVRFFPWEEIKLEPGDYKLVGYLNEHPDLTDSLEFRVVRPEDLAD
ncbi:MAG: hypothetical protein V2A74_08070 [bacterium]